MTTIAASGPLPATRMARSSWRWWLLAAAATVVLVTGTALMATAEPTFAVSPIVDVMIVIAIGAVSAAGLALWRRWPTNPSGVLVAISGLLLGLLNVSFWVDSSWSGGVPAILLSVGWFTSMSWAVVAWPTGRTTKTTRRLLIAIACALGLELVSTVLQRHPDGPHGDVNPWGLADLGTLSQLADVTATAAAALAGLALFAVLVRRTQPLTGPARRLARPAVTAGVLLWLVNALLAITRNLLGDLQLHGGQLTVFGVVLGCIDWGRLTVLAVVLWTAAQRSEVGRVQEPGSVELGPAADALRVETRLAAALGDPTLRVAYRTEAGQWVDADGVPVGSPSDEGGQRAVTLIEADGEPIVALSADASLATSPALVGSVAAATGLAVRHQRLEALAAARLREVRAAGLAVIEAEDSARRRLERDLHDGAQQRLVGLALQAGLAAGRPTLEAVEEVADGVSAAEAELDHLVAGILPAVLAERGLGAALRAVAATSPLAVDLHVHVPGGLHPGAAVVAWFVVCEGIANAVKHSRAEHLGVLVGVEGGQLTVEVTDDGIGGADSASAGLAGLAERVTRAGGALTVTSPLGAGTSIRAWVPMDAVVAA